jgi:hypothetical protein
MAPTPIGVPPEGAMAPEGEVVGIAGPVMFDGPARAPPPGDVAGGGERGGSSPR